MKRTLCFAAAFLCSTRAWSQSDPSECADNEFFDVSTAMCRPLNQGEPSRSEWMVHGNGFFLQTFESGPRGWNAFSVPNMMMVDSTQTFGTRHALTMEGMITVERWTYPSRGTPELLQIGEFQQNGLPYLDAQHPHSTPLMGLTISDTVWLGENRDYLRVWFAPRGSSTDGPIPFMHRPTGAVNPQAPLGHHIGQDVGHISGTVLGAALHFGRQTLEVSTFNGTEPDPTRVDLPVATPNSYAIRFTQEFSQRFFAMISAANVAHIDSSAPTAPDVQRFSASVYNVGSVGTAWQFHNALIWGMITHYDQSSDLHSFTEEFVLEHKQYSFWGRLEELQRTPEELEINPSGSPHTGQWVTAITLGTTYALKSWDYLHVGIGGSVTADILPADFQQAYGRTPCAANVFLQVGGMAMGND